MNSRRNVTWYLILILIGLSCARNGTAQVCLKPDSVTTFNDWFHLGTTHLINREWTPALQAYRNALQFNPDESQKAAIHQNLGSLHFLLADYQKAAIQFEYAFNLLNGRPSNPSRLAEICLNLGFTWLEKGDPDAAQHWFDLAGRYPLPDQVLWQKRLDLGTGNVLFAKGWYREAISTYRKALSGCSATDPASEEELWLLKNLAWSFQAVGESDSARLALDQALDRIILTGKADDFVLPEILLQKSILLSSSGNLNEALQSLNEALDQMGGERIHPVESPIVPNQFTTMDVLRYRIFCEKIRISWQLFNPKKENAATCDSLFKETLSFLKSGEDLARNERLRELFTMQPQPQRSLTGIALELLLLMDQDSTRTLDRSVNITERLIGFEAQCQNTKNFAVEILPDTLKSDLIGLKRQLFKLHKQRLLEEAGSLLPPAEIVEEEVRILDRLSRLESPRSEKTGEDSFVNQDTSTSGAPSNFVQLKSLIQQDEALITYLLIDTTLYIFLLTSDTAFIFKQSAGEDSYREVRTCIRALKGLDPPAFYQSSSRVYSWLLNPVEKQLKNRFYLRIIPDRQFRELPFDALLVRDSLHPASSLNYLIHRFETTCYTSIASLLKHRVDAVSSSGSLGYIYDFGACAPVFSGQGATFLPHAITEVQKIASLFTSKGKRVRTITGTGFTIDTLTALGEQSRIFHLATHGFRDSAHPEFSGWMLPGDPTPSPDRRITEKLIEIGDLQHFKMGADLVVLSSCSIGNQQGRNWYRINRFPENFFRAGVRQILFSLWDISDYCTSEFMFSFYRYYLDGMNYSAALRAAKLQMLATNETAFPTTWAVFVLWSD